MGKTVFITGATDGTGYAIASRYAREGYDVFITSRDEERARKAANKLMEEHKNIKAFGYGLDTAGEENVIAVFEDIRKKGYLIDTLVCNAADLGIGMDAFTVDLKRFMKVFEVNLGWNFSIARHAALMMREKNHGAIVFITSNTAYRAIPNRCAYGASKSGILGLARSLAVDWGKYGIRVNCVLPGMIKTSRWEENEAIRNAPSNNTPIGDIASFEDIANAAWFLGSCEAGNVTGAELTVDGGNMIQLYPVNVK